MEAESKPPHLTSILPTCVNCIHGEEVTAVGMQLACGRCEQNTQDSWGHLMFYLLLQIATSSCFPFFSSPDFLPPLSDSKTGRLQRDPRTRKAMCLWCEELAKWQALQARNSHLKSLWTPCPNLSQQRPTPPFPSGTEHWRGHSDLQSEN